MFKIPVNYSVNFIELVEFIANSRSSRYVWNFVPKIAEFYLFVDSTCVNIFVLTELFARERHGFRILTWYCNVIVKILNLFLISLIQGANL